MTADKDKIHSNIYLFCIALLMTGMLFSNFLMSIAQILLAINWIAEGNLKGKLKLFISNPVALILTSIFVIHILGLTYTSDFEYGLHDIKVKLPLAILPLIFCTITPIKKKDFQRLMLFFIAVVTVATIVSFIIKLSGRATDVRKTSLFISHIRFGLQVCLAFFTGLYFIFRPGLKSGCKVLLVLLVAWFLIFLVILEAATALIIIVIVSVLLLIYLALKNSSNYIRIPAVCLIILIPALSCLYCIRTFNAYGKAEKVDITKLEQNTRSGNPYVHDTSAFQIENGRYPGLFICNTEIESAWNKRGTMKIVKTGSNYPMLYYTLIRFLSSKGYRKDADGINKLTDDEIKAIENGVANAEYMNILGLKSRIYKIAFEFSSYRATGNTRNMSVMQRIELWKTAARLIRKHFWTGVGTGDVKNQFRDELVSDNSTLQDKGLRAHNQLLTFFIAFGIFGFTWFLFSLFYPLVSSKKHFHYFFVILFTVAFMSMLTEDTLETQAGVTFYAFFTSFFLFQYNIKSEN